MRIIYRMVYLGVYWVCTKNPGMPNAMQVGPIPLIVLSQAQFLGAGRCLSAVAHPQLTAQVMDVCLGRPRADI